MAQLYTPHRLVALPGTLAANSIYYTQTGTPGELQITVTGNTAAVVNSTITQAEIATLIDNAILSAATLNQEILVAATITARDALVWTNNGLVLVADATADPDVATGAAIYFYDLANGTYTLTSEMADLNLVIEWSDIQNVPAAVSGLSVNGAGDLTFNSKSMGGMYFETTDW